VSGGAGAGLLLLRLALAAAIGFDAVRVFVARDLDPLPFTMVAYAVLAIACAAVVALGFLTPAAELTIILMEASAIGSRWSFAAVPAFAAPPLQLALLEAAVAMSLVLVGPGAYSLDAVLFGRHEITIPPLHQRGIHSSPSSH